MKRVVRSSVSCLLLLLIVSLTALAASSKGISTSKDGRRTTASQPASFSNPLRANPLSGLKIIYDNASNYPLGVYWCCSGYTITGSGSAVGTQYADGMSFTPSVNATVTHIGLAVGYVSGDNEIAVSLNADNNGLPGNALGSFTLSSLPAFGDCCSVEVESLTGVPVTAGTPYWIVVQTTTPTSTTWVVWNDNDTDQTLQPTAYQNAGVWQTSEGIVAAFGVAGTE